MSENKKIKKGGISVDTANMFPIIKKWLYSEKDIFIRELVSNACDAITKHKRLCSIGEAVDDSSDYKIDVILDKELSRLIISDNGIGMNESEVDKYINQIALSGAVDFMEKYESENETGQADGIIGHFGLGFYSAFMVADTVEIKTKSYRNEDEAVSWKGNDEGEFEMTFLDDKKERGTEIILHLNDDETEYKDSQKIKSILEKYCAFMPYDIFFIDKGDTEEKDTEKNPINDKNPLWQQRAQDITEEQYKDFYKKVFNDYTEPLFQIHINADYPLNFKGIIYFPKISHEYDNLEGQIKLYYNQVFVADNIKEVIPEYMMMLKGVLDCPELPLNVSRSYLQTNGYVSRISAHITKKIADKLNSLFNLEREKYEGFWDYIKPFVEYGCLKDEKFYERVKDIVLFKTTENKYLTLKEYAAQESFDNTVYYTDDITRQSRYISLFAAENIDVIVLDKLIDSNFISLVEHKHTDSEEYKGLKFVRVDAGLSGRLKKDSKEKLDDEKSKQLKDFFKRAIGAGEKFSLSCEYLKDEEIPAVINISEQSRRFADMMKIYAGGNDNELPHEETLVLNLSNSLVEKISNSLPEKAEDKLTLSLAKQVYMLALIAHRPLLADELKGFISDNISLFEKL